MKKIIFFVAALALFASCNKDQFQESETIETVPVTINASLPETKATIGVMTWEAGDQITVWVASHLNDEGYNGNVLDLVDATTGKFAGEIATPLSEDTYYAAYNALGFDKENKAPIFNISATQADASNGASKAMLSGTYTGALSGLSFTMASTSAKLKITFNQAIKQVTFAGMNDENIIGTNKEIVYTNTDSQGASVVEFIIPAMTFTNGYKLIVEGLNQGEIMYQAFSGSKSFTAGHVRNVTLDFVPFSITAVIDEINPPMTSYSYYLKGDYDNANSSVFETVGRLGQGSDPDTYDNNVQGVFTGNIQGGKAKIVVNGASSSLIPAGYTVKEYGYYRSVNGSAKTKVKVGENLNLSLSKNISWWVEGEDSNYTTYDQGKVSLQPYIIVNNGTGDTEYHQDPVDFYITGLPHRSDHKDLWYVEPHHDDGGRVSGKVQRHLDGSKKFECDMFYNNNSDGGWDDFAVRSQMFSIPTGSQINVKPVMYGVLWGGASTYRLHAYFYFDSTNNTDGYIFHKEKTTDNDHKLTSPTPDVTIELPHSGNTVDYRFMDINKVVALSHERPELSIYIWMYRYASFTFDHPGYWCRYIKVQYSAPANN